MPRSAYQHHVTFLIRNRLAPNDDIIHMWCMLMAFSYNAIIQWSVKYTSIPSPPPTHKHAVHEWHHQHQWFYMLAQSISVIHLQASLHQLYHKWTSVSTQLNTPRSILQCTVLVIQCMHTTKLCNKYITLPRHILNIVNARRLG